LLIINTLLSIKANSQEVVYGKKFHKLLIYPCGIAQNLTHIRKQKSPAVEDEAWSVSFL